MASLLDVLIFDAVYGSWILSLPLFTLANRMMVFMVIASRGSEQMLHCHYHIQLQYEYMISMAIPR